MLKSLYAKLALAFVGVAFGTAALVALFISITSNDRLGKLILDQQRSSMQTALVSYYTSQGSWQGVSESWRLLQFNAAASGQAPGGSFPQQQGSPQPGDHQGRSLFGLADAQGVVVVAVDPAYPVGSQLPRSVLKNGTPIQVDGASVGTLLTVKNLTSFNPEETLFLRRTTQALLLAVLGAVAAALAAGLVLARTLTRPLKALTQAAQHIAEGELQQEVKLTSKDEIGQLAAAFNRMSQEVARVHQMRKQMTADIAHDLRTPLTVISGYVESMRDGVLSPTTQRLDVIYTEIERMQNLVGDLRMLSLVDAGELPLNPQVLPPAGLLERAVQLFQHQAGQQNVSLEMQLEPNLPDVRMDEARMMQVLDNLLSNALRYTPPGGTVTLGAQQREGYVQLSVTDTGSGIDPAELPFIFDRFHRADKSRHADNGESGLGLAIVKALTEAHGGRVWAQSAPGSGAAFTVELPIA